jgi:release factor glutamine methyltransferase
VTTTGAAPAKVWTVRELLAWSRGWFEQKGVESPRLTAEILLAHVLDVQRIRLYVDIERPLEKDELARYRELLQRRAKGEPVQYLVGGAEFYGRRFAVDARALIPRPETELLVERVLRHRDASLPLRFLDVGCGSGAIGLTLAAERSNATGVLVDLSPDAAALARENAERLGVSERVDVRVGDLLAPVAGESFDAVVANLPYIPEGEKESLAVHIRDHEPHLALFSGSDGLDAYRRLVPELAAFVPSGGLAVLEHHEAHGEPLAALFPSSDWSDVTCERDLAGLPRFTWALRR